ncbi:MAG: type II toxin-antitoxin system RelE/ParE family toxin [Deltaproteobacteria bacterium]|nr:type II toxin-antitoxin system RelE/ParE family toxin [Deltaproteobacteria bacterium]
MAKIVWTEGAKDDLARLRDEIRRLSPQGAKRIGARVIELVRHLRTNPEMGRPGRIEGTRELVVTTTELIVPLCRRAGRRRRARGRERPPRPLIAAEASAHWGTRIVLAESDTRTSSSTRNPG